MTLSPINFSDLEKVLGTGSVGPPTFLCTDRMILSILVPRASHWAFRWAHWCLQSRQLDIGRDYDESVDLFGEYFNLTTKSSDLQIGNFSSFRQCEISFEHFFFAISHTYVVFLLVSLCLHILFFLILSSRELFS